MVSEWEDRYGITLRIQASHIRMDLYWLWIHVNLEFLIELNLLRQIPENTDWAKSELILLAMVFLWSLSSWLSYILWDRNLRIQTELYPDWYWLWNSCEPWVPILSCILWDRYLRIQTEPYPDWYWLWYLCEPWVPILSCTWIERCVRPFLGVRHILHSKRNVYKRGNSVFSFWYIYC